MVLGEMAAFLQVGVIEGAEMGGVGEAEVVELQAEILFELEKFLLLDRDVIL